VAVGFLSSALAFVTFSFLWWGLALFNLGSFIPFQIVLMGTAAMFILGFFTLDNYAANIISSAWHIIIKIFSTLFRW